MSGTQSDVISTILPSFPWKAGDRLEAVTLNNAIFTCLDLISSQARRIDQVVVDENRLQGEIDAFTIALALLQQNLNGVQSQINSFEALVSLVQFNQTVDHNLILLLQQNIATLRQNADQLQSQIDALRAALNILTEIVTGGSSEWSTESGFVMTTEDNDTIYWVVSSATPRTASFQTESGDTITDYDGSPLEFVN